MPLNISTFIERARAVHGDKYDYSNVHYVNIKKKVTITCKMHGSFNQVAETHLDGSGCPKCGLLSRSNKKRSDTDEFVAKAKLKHGDKYDYSIVDYSCA